MLSETEYAKLPSLSNCARPKSIHVAHCIDSLYIHLQMRRMTFKASLRIDVTTRYMAKDAGERYEQSLLNTGRIVTLRKKAKNEATREEAITATVACNVQSRTSNPDRKRTEASCSKMEGTTTIVPTRHLSSPFRRCCRSRALWRELPPTVAS